MEKKRKQRSKSKGNGEGSIYYCTAKGIFVGQYSINGKRHSVYQKKKESVKNFKNRFNKILNDINQGTYIGNSKETIVILALQYIENKHNDGTTGDRSYGRDLGTLEQLKKTCSNFCNLPIQKVTIRHIENAKKNMREYSNSVISKIWRLLNKAFSIACSPSRKILVYNLMQDETLKKPISTKATKKIIALTNAEYEKLNSILDNQERNHPYRDIAKVQLISGMRIGEVLARSKADYNQETDLLDIHNTLTEDENGHIILGKHTKTFNKKTQIDEGKRFLPLYKKAFTEVSTIIKERCNQKIQNIYNLLFWDYKNNTFISPREINSWLKRLNKKYKISKTELTTHRLRHSAITHWKEAGMDLSAIQYLAGHIQGSDITEKVYIDTSLEFVEKELDKAV